MIRRIFCALLALALMGVNAARAEMDCGLVRLHVVADSDDPGAQWLKLQVRDAALEAAQRLLADCEGTEEAWQRVCAERETFEEIAEARARQLGCGDPVRAETGIFPFPDRTYGDVTVPAGDYRALRIIIGDGEGQNWWCVLYPTLCLDSDDGYYSILGLWLRKWFGGMIE